MNIFYTMMNKEQRWILARYLTVKIKTLKKNRIFYQNSRRQRSSSSTNLVSTITPSIMPNLTYCKNGHKATGKENPPVMSTSSKHVIVPKKHVPQPPANKKSASKAKHVPEVEDAEDVDDSEPEPVMDISNQTYSLHKSVVVGDTVIVGDTDFLTHEEFVYRQFETYNIRKLNDAAEKCKFTFEYLSRTATIMVNGVRICDNLILAVEDNHEKG